MIKEIMIIYTLWFLINILLETEENKSNFWSFIPVLNAASE